MRAIAGFRLVTGAIDRLVRFYQAIGFTPGDERRIDPAELAMLGLAGGGTRVPLTLGASLIELDCYDTQGAAYPADAGAADIVFQHFALVTDDAGHAFSHVLAAGASAISRTEPVTLPPATGGVIAVKFRDPDGHPLELLQFAGQVNPVWPDCGGPDCGVPDYGLMGIDHSAIAVGDVDRSLAFYTAHGLAVGHRTLNAGPAQAMLDGLDNPLVDVVPLLAQTRPAHLELLGYRRPRGAALSGWNVNDIAATRVVWQADRDALIRDPDGHLHQFEKR